MSARARTLLFCGVIAVASMPAFWPASAGDVGISAGFGSFNVPVISRKEIRFQTVVKQQYDFSCGSAAVASLLTYHYDRPTSEKEVFKTMYDTGDKEAIRTEGFSLYDMKKYLEARGYRADGFRMSLDKIAKNRIPSIVLIEIKGYRHFVLIKGVRGDEVIVGDPALGTAIYKKAKFDGLRVGNIALLIRNQTKIARSHFNQQEDWSIRADAPVESAINRYGLSNFNTSLPGHNEF